MRWLGKKVKAARAEYGGEWPRFNAHGLNSARRAWFEASAVILLALAKPKRLPFGVARRCEAKPSLEGRRLYLTMTWA
jgi:hypothetical protein